MKSFSRFPRLAAIPAAVALSTLATLASAEIQTKTVTYEVNGESYTGYMAYDDSLSGERPGVLVVHEWWGHNEFARDQAERLAGEGYVGFALDMYGSGILAEHPEDAKKFMQEATKDMEQVKARFLAAKALLESQDMVDDDKIAAQGYCFGGAVVLNMARMGVDLDAVSSFHGSLASPITAEPGTIKPKIHVYTGGADGFVPTEQVAGLVTEMQTAQADLTLVSFPDAVHSFTNPGADEKGSKFGLPLKYNKDADERSWAGTMALYEDVFAD